MKQHLAIIGFGRLGKACAQAILQDERFALVGIVRSPEHVLERLPAPFAQSPVVAHVSELGGVDAALICVPTEHVLGVAHDLLQQRISLVECATLHGAEFQAHKAELDRMATHHKTAAIVGAGWDPGVLSLFRSLFALLIPHGHTEARHRPGINLHHTTVAGTIAGVKAALATELRASSGQMQRYVYIELADKADFATVEQAIRNEPLFVGEDTQVFQVDDIATLEDEGHGILLERRGQSSATDHQLFLLEGRFSEAALAAQVMVFASLALSSHHGRAYCLQDLPLSALWGEMREWAEKEWI